MGMGIDRYAESEMAESNERGCAIIGGAYLEEKLTRAVRQMLVRDDEIFEEMFRPSGVLGAFENKIRIAYMIGMITEPFMNDLMKLKEVHDRFAHRLYIKEFDHAEIKILLGEFHLVSVGVRIEKRANKEICSNRRRFEKAILEAGRILTSGFLPKEFTPFI